MSTVLFVVDGGFAHQDAEGALTRAGHRVLKETREQVVGSPRARISRAIFVDDQTACDSLRLCSQLRTVGFGGAVFLIAPSPIGARLVEALDAGADDLLTAPLDVNIVLARLRAADRRSVRATPNQESLRLVPDETERFASLGATKVRLTTVEARILSALCQADGDLVPGEHLRASASPEAPLSRASLQVHVAHIRGKLGANGWRIQNCRAHGYRLWRSTLA